MCRRDFPYIAYVNKNHATAEIHPNTAQITSLLFFFPSAHTQDGVFTTFHAREVSFSVTVYFGYV